MKSFVLILSFVAFACCTPVAQDENLIKSVIGNLVDCVNSDLDVCLKEHALKAADRLTSARKLKIIDGITLINNSPRESRSLDSLPSDHDERNKQLTERLWKSTGDLLQVSELELSYAGGDEGEESRAIDDAVEESRGKKKKLKKKLKILIPLMILAKAKAIALAVLALLIIALSVFKLAAIAKIAFIIKLIAIIKALLLAKKHSHTEETYEVVASPHHGWEPHSVEHSHVDHGHGWEGGWSRSRNEANNLAYNAYN